MNWTIDDVTNISKFISPGNLLSLQFGYQSHKIMETLRLDRKPFAILIKPQ